MSLFSALNVALSSINVINTQIATISDNVSNADNEDYNSRSVSLKNLQHGGVVSSGILRMTNTGLKYDLHDANSNYAADNVRSSTYDRLEQLTGTINGSAPLSSYTESFVTSWKTYEAAPESDAAHRDVLTAGSDITAELERLSDGIDIIERSVKDDIIDNTQNLNDILTEIASLNASIVRDKGSFRDYSKLDNLRDAELDKLSNIMDIKVIPREDGGMAVYSKNGTFLVDHTPVTFNWSEASLHLTIGTSTTNIATSLAEGSLKAQYDIIRTDGAAIVNSSGSMAPIQKLKNSLDEFAYSLTDNSTASTAGNIYINGVTDMTSITGIAANDQFSIAVNGGAATTITITAGMSASALVTAIDAVAGVNGRIDAHGQLHISTTGGTLDIAEITNTPAAAIGLSVGTNAVNSPDTFARAYTQVTALAGEAANFFEVKSGTEADNTSRLNIRVNDTIVNGTERIKQNSGNAVVAALIGTSRDFAGSAMSLTNETYVGLSAGILTDITNRSERYTILMESNQLHRDNLYESLRNDVGVNVDQEMARLTVFQNSYAATARVIEAANQMLQALENAV